MSTPLIFASVSGGIGQNSQWEVIILACFADRTGIP